MKEKSTSTNSQTDKLPNVHPVDLHDIKPSGTPIIVKGTKSRPSK